ncbi:hypothetical protein [Bradyrhizobium liaoningense]
MKLKRDGGNRRQNRMIYARICPFCDDAFLTTDVRKLVCSIECRKLRSNEQNKEYKSLHAQRLRGLRQVHYAKHRKKILTEKERTRRINQALGLKGDGTPRVEISCVACGNKFQRLGGRKLTCSRTCAHQAAVKRRNVNGWADYMRSWRRDNANAIADYNRKYEENSQASRKALEELFNVRTSGRLARQLVKEIETKGIGALL